MQCVARIAWFLNPSGSLGASAADAREALCRLSFHRIRSSRKAVVGDGIGRAHTDVWGARKLTVKRFEKRGAFPVIGGDLPGCWLTNRGAASAQR